MRTFYTIFAIAIYSILCGCMSSRLEIDRSYPYVGGRTYTANMKKLQSYAKTSLPECAKGDKFCVINPNIVDLKSPLKMVVDSSSWTDKNGLSGDWEMILYHVVPDSEKGAEVVATVLRADSKQMDNLIRKEVLKYIREGVADECKEWRDWAANTNYVALASQPPRIMFAGEDFNDMVRSDLISPIYNIMSFPGSGTINFLTSRIKRLQELGILKVTGNGRAVELSIVRDNHDALMALNNPLGRLAGMIETARDSRLPRYEIVDELSKRAMARKATLKKQLDAAAAKKRAEELRIAEELMKAAAAERRRQEVAERKRQEEVAKLKRQDLLLLSGMDETIARWKRSHKQAIERVAQSENVLKALALFAKENGTPSIAVPLKMNFSYNMDEAKSKVEFWKRVKKVDWDLITSGRSFARAKQIYGLEEYCNALDERIWKAVLKSCANDEAVSFKKKFVKKEMPNSELAVDLILAKQDSSFMQSVEFVEGTIYPLGKYRSGSSAKIGALFDEDTGAWNVAVRIGFFYMLPDDDPYRTKIIIISGLKSNVATGKSLSPDERVIYKGVIKGVNGFGNTVNYHHFEVFNEDEWDMADVSEYDIVPGKKGVKIDEELYNFYFTSTNSPLVIENHRIGNDFIIRKNTQLKTVIAREGGVIIGAFGVRFGVMPKDLSAEDVGKVGDPVPIPESGGGGFSFTYDYQGNRGFWDEFSFQTGGEDHPTIYRIMASKTYDSEAKALLDAKDIRDFLKKYYGIPTARNPMAKDCGVWLQMFDQPGGMVLLAVKVFEKGGKYHLTYSLSDFTKDKKAD